LSDEKLYESSYKIQDAIRYLKESKVDVVNVIADLEKLVIKLQKDADDSNPLNKVLDDVLNEKNRKALTKKVKKHLEKEIPWKYVDWCQCYVKRDGTVKIEEYQR
jgi:allophanate hydrolase subunit 1